MANTTFEMVGDFIQGTTDYAISVSNFPPTNFEVFVISQTTISAGNIQTLVALLGTANYTLLTTETGYSIRFESDIVNSYVSFVIRAPYSRAGNTWLTLTSNSQITYANLNTQNTEVFQAFYNKYDFDENRMFLLETAYKYEEMKILPYLDEAYIWIKQGGRMRGIHKSDLIKDELDLIRSILVIMQGIQTDVADKYNQISQYYNAIINYYNQISSWNNSIQETYALIQGLKVEMQNLYNTMIADGNNIINQITVLSAQNIQNMLITLNDALVSINNSKDGTLADIESAKNQAIQDIIDAAAEIIGGDFLLRGATTYTNAKEIEDAILNLEQNMGGLKDMTEIWSGNTPIATSDFVDVIIEDILTSDIDRGVLVITMYNVFSSNTSYYYDLIVPVPKLDIGFNGMFPVGGGQTTSLIVFQVKRIDGDDLQLYCDPSIYMGYPAGVNITNIYHIK